MKIKKTKVCCIVITVHVLKTAKILRFSLFWSMHYDNLPHEQRLRFFHALQTNTYHNSMTHAKSSKEQVVLFHMCV